MVNLPIICSSWFTFSSHPSSRVGVLSNLPIAYSFCQRAITAYAMEYFLLAAAVVVPPLIIDSTTFLLKSLCKW